MSPAASGFEVCSRLREGEPGRSWNRDVPVIMVSSRSEPVDRLRGFARGCDDSIAMPFMHEELLVLRTDHDAGEFKERLVPQKEANLKVTIIGAGNMGRGVGTRAVAGGHEVEIVDRDAAEAQKLAGELGDLATALEPGAALGGDVVVLALYYPGNKDAVQQYADQIAGKVVVDVSNPVDTNTWDRLATPPGTSAAEELQGLVPEGTPVVKAFNTTFAGTLASDRVEGQQLDVFVAGDNTSAKEKVSQLILDSGLRPIDTGPLSRAQQLEQLGFLHIALQEPLGLGFGSAVKLHP